jgi:hypothetical protein
MKRKLNKIIEFLPSEKIIMIVGNYGSGKTELSVNLAIQWVSAGHEVQIADLDIVNPYFRCREAQKLMEHNKIRVVVPPGAMASADLPVVVPEIQGMLDPKTKGIRLFDVGGDEVGARLLASLSKRIENLKQPYSLWQVINSKRPFTHRVSGCIAMMESIEKASRLKISGFVANSHLMEETTPEVILEGWKLAHAVAAQTGRPLKFVTAMEDLADALELRAIDVPVLRLHRHMLPPWLDSNQPKTTHLPAQRPVPIGRPTGVN